MAFIIYGLSVAVLWLFSNAEKKHKKLVQQLATPLAVAYLLLGIIEYIGFFPFAETMSFFAGLSVLMGVLSGRKADE